MMIKFFLYFVVLIAFIPLISSGNIRPRVHRHISERRDNDSIKLVMTFRPPQDSIKNANRKIIKEVARAKPQSKPEKVVRRDPDDRPANPNPGNAARPAIRPGDRPVGGARGARPQAPPARHGR